MTKGAFMYVKQHDGEANTSMRVYYEALMKTLRAATGLASTLSRQTFLFRQIITGEQYNKQTF